MEPEHAFGLILVVALIVSIVLRSMGKRSQGDSECSPDKENADEFSRKVRSEFSLPANAKGLDSDFSATKALVETVLSNQREAPEKRGG